VRNLSGFVGKGKEIAEPKPCGRLLRDLAVEAYSETSKNEGSRLHAYFCLSWESGWSDVFYRQSNQLCIDVDNNWLALQLLRQLPRGLGLGGWEIASRDELLNALRGC